MKIEIEIADNWFLSKKQLKAITEEIIKNMVVVEPAKNDIFSTYTTKINIPESKKSICGSTKFGYNMFYTKKTTPKGTIKINVWGGI